MSLIYTAGRWQVDLHRRELRADGRPVPIGMRAFEIIEVLVQFAGTVVTKDDLMRAVWPGAIVEEATLWVHISAIRRALGADRLMLRTVSRRGYQLMGNWAATPSDAAPGDDAVDAGGRAHRQSTNIPETQLDLIGRSAEIQSLLDLSSAYRAITLTGPGGIGKTALALAVAQKLLPGFNGKGWFVDLSSLSDPSLLASAVAAAIGLRLGGDAITPQTIGQAIGRTKLLLILDNCEHVIEAASSLADIIVRFCPYVSIVSTSRETLQIAGEYVYRVPPLMTPPSGNQDSETILQYSAIQLFLVRTKALCLDFTPDGAALCRIASICASLDGIPLAIEFASACAASIGLREIEHRLADRFGLLTGGRRTAPPRHQTLAATLEWSYQLLSGWEQLLLRHLAVFRGGFTLNAAISVVGGGLAAPSDVVKGVRNLVTKSLVASDGPAVAGRLRLLETTRAYASRELDAKGETQSARKHHAQYFRDFLAASAQASHSTPSIIEQGREIDNVRAALDWAFSAAGDPAVGVALTAMYAPMLLHLSLLLETKDRVEQALANLSVQPDWPLMIRMKLHAALGVTLIFMMGPMTRIRSAINLALQAARHLNDEGTELQALWAVWVLDTGVGNIRDGQSTVEQFEHLARRLGDPGLVAFADRLAGYTLHLAGAHRDAERRFRQVIDAPSIPATERYTILNFDHHAVSRAGLAVTLYLQGFIDRAADESQASLDEALATRHLVSTYEVIRLAVFPIAVMAEDFAAAEQAIALLVDLAASQNATYWIILGQFQKGELAVRRGAFAPGVALLRDAFDRCRGNGWASRYSQFLAVLAEGLAGLGHLSEALSTIETALARAQRGGELIYAPEILRTQGELLLKLGRPGPATAEGCFRQAIHMARQQGALLWELRATLSVARLKAQQGRREEARSALSIIYDRFTEGFESVDLRAVRSLLGELLTGEQAVRVLRSPGRGRQRA